MRYGKGGLQHGQATDHVIGEEGVRHVVLYLRRNHLRVLRWLLPLTPPPQHPLGRRLREDAPEVDQEGRVAIAVIEIGEQPQLFLVGEHTFLFGSRLHKFLQHLAYFLVGEGEAADEELSGEEEYGF